jgi:hypothetical protein
VKSTPQFSVSVNPCLFVCLVYTLYNILSLYISCCFSSYLYIFVSNWYWIFECQDLPFKPKYLVTFTVGISQKDNINNAVKKVPLLGNIFIISETTLTSPVL